VEFTVEVTSRQTNKSRQMNKRTLGVPGDFGPVTDARDEDRLPMLPPAQQVLQDCCLVRL
jgi:hypothetical protein